MIERIACGSWPSLLSSRRVAEGALRLSQPTLDRGRVYWIEGRPSEGGRQVLATARPGQAGRDLQEVSPPGLNVRGCVHEYGGGDYLVRGGRVFFVGFPGSELHAAAEDGRGAQCLLRSEQALVADADLSPDGRWLVLVEERARPGDEPLNRLVGLRLGAGSPAAPEPIASGHDFVSFPRFSPDGRSLAYTAWDHPDMPWDGTRLFAQSWGPDGPTAEPRCVAGGRGESIFQPRFSPGGVLTFASDRSGFWNLYQLRESGVHALCPRDAEFGRPQWVFGMSSYAFAEEQRLICAVTDAGRDRLAELDLRSGRLNDLGLPFSSIGGVQAEGSGVCFVGAAPDRAAAVVHLDLASGSFEALRSSAAADPSLEGDAGGISLPEAIEFAGAEGRATHAFFYPPVGRGASSAALAPLAGELPPLLVKSHGGPTAAASTALNPSVQYWTSRGIAVVDVNYGGSTGYGRAYRERLDGQWGVVDVEDCIGAARHLAGEGRVDPRRLAISGGSAGGYTTLCALTFHDDFAAGASHYGIGDLEALVRDTHKFESRYLDRLVGPYPECRALYRERSPIHSTDRLACPVIFFQGLEDKVVPPNQAEAMADALARRGIPHAYVPFEGEQHGFRRAENICTALDGELYFYSRVFGFEVEVRPDAVRIVG